MLWLYTFCQQYNCSGLGCWLATVAKVHLDIPHDWTIVWAAQLTWTENAGKSLCIWMRINKSFWLIVQIYAIVARNTVTIYFAGSIVNWNVEGGNRRQINPLPEWNWIVLNGMGFWCRRRMYHMTIHLWLWSNDVDFGKPCGQPPPNVWKACSHWFQRAFDIPLESSWWGESKTALSMV